MCIPDFIMIHGHTYYTATSTTGIIEGFTLISAGHFSYDEAVCIGTDACEALGVSSFTLRSAASGYAASGLDAAIIEIKNVKIEEVIKWQV